MTPEQLTELKQAWPGPKWTLYAAVATASAGTHTVKVQAPFLTKDYWYVRMTVFNPHGLRDPTFDVVVRELDIVTARKEIRRKVQGIRNEIDKAQRTLL